MSSRIDSTLLNRTFLFEGTSPPPAYVSSIEFKNLDDTDLLKYFKDGTRSQRIDAFNTIYNRYRMDIFLVLVSKEIPLEPTKDLFAKIWGVFIKALPEFVIEDTKEPFKRFLMKVLKITCDAYFRITSEQDDIPLDDILNKEIKDDPLSDDDTSRKNARLLHQYAAKLGKRDTKIFLLRIYKQYSHVEIGDKLNISTSAARTAWHRIVEKLKKMHQEEKKNG